MDRSFRDIPREPLPGMSAAPSRSNVLREPMTGKLLKAGADVKAKSTDIKGPRLARSTDQEVGEE